MPLKKAPYEIPEVKKIRVIIDTDCNCEADDHFAISHALMTPKFDVKAVCAEHFGTSFGKTNAADTEDQSYKEVCKVLDLMGLTGEVPILEGCKELLSDEKTYVESPASRFIVEEAIKEDPRHLFVVGQGALTNLASAYLMEPKIADKITAIWIGGGTYPEGGWEFNLCNDITAANVIMDSSMELWQVPMDVYSLMKVSFATLYDRVYPYGEIGKYMVENMMRVNHEINKAMAELKEAQMSGDGSEAGGFTFEISTSGGESWQLGDSPVVGLLLADHENHYTVEGAPRFEYTTGKYELRPDNERKIRVYHYVDSYFILEDFFAKIKYYYGE